MITIPELFERKTVKSIDSIFDLDEYKDLIRGYIEYGEWFTVAGLRRTGKTTLVRFIIKSLGVPSIYVNLWELVPKGVSLDALMNKMLQEFSDEFKGRIRSISKHIKEIALFGIRIRFSEERPSEGVTQAIKRVLKEKRKLVIVLDEVQELNQEI